MIYITYDPVTGKVDPISFSEEYMIPAGKQYLEITEEAWNAAMGKDMKVIDGSFVWSDPLPTPKDYDDAMEAHLKAEREARGYTLREPSDYAGSTVPRWAQDAQDWIIHRDAVMNYALEVMNHYAETGEAPTLEEFKAALPVITWTYNAESEAAEA